LLVSVETSDSETMSTVPNEAAAGPLDAEGKFYRRILQALETAGVPVLVGGAFALGVYTGIERRTKDFDLFLRRTDYDRAAQVLQALGHPTELAFPHWLGKAHAGPWFVDLIFDSGNGVARVDDAWFEHAVDADVLGLPAKIVPVEEMIWSKAFIMERERYDGADIAHLLRARAHVLDWSRLLERMGPNWRVLLAHLVLFGFIYPGERLRIPAGVTEELLDRLREEMQAPAETDRLCRGTLISREQYLHDVDREGYIDARVRPHGTMSVEDIAVWTAAIGEGTNEK
jgi:hypothetical protein